MVYTKNDVNSLVKSLIQLLGDEQLRTAYRRKAYERAVSRFSWSAVTAEYLELFEAVLSGVKRH